MTYLNKTQLQNSNLRKYYMNNKGIFKGKATYITKFV